MAGASNRHDQPGQKSEADACDQNGRADAG